MTGGPSFNKVFGLGLSRTATTSLGNALTRLGVPTTHYPHDTTTLTELRSGHGQLSILDHYRGVVDISVAPFYPQLDRAYPGSKFILTRRDKASWLRSMQRHYEMLALGRESFSPEFQEFTNFISEQIYGATEFDEARFARAFDRHHRQVLNYFGRRPDDLLVFDLIGGQGWDVLCSFLGVPAPEGPLPHTNAQRNVGRWVEWNTQCQELRSAIDRIVPPESVVVLVDDGTLPARASRRHTEVPFLERDGRYWGRPPTDEVAIGEVERMRASGADFMVFAAPALWWLDHYDGLRRHLRSRFACSAESTDYIVFDLTTAAPSRPDDATTER